VRRLAPRRLNAALDALTADLAPATTLARVQARWPDAVGAAIAAEAEPVAEREGVVTVACRSAVWAQELDLLGPDLVARLNAALGTSEGAGPVRKLRPVASRPRGR
jgi:predicted nucleic acid-binding Zn ribbon protein